MLLAAEVFDAPTMLARGFLLQVQSDAEVTTHSQALAQRVARLAPQAARLNKQTLREIQESNSPMGLVDVSQSAPDLIANMSTTAYAYADSTEHREGITAFLAKRQPQF
jgi:enoyl-CoA hydratase/carnithine racemase